MGIIVGVILTALLVASVCLMVYTIDTGEGIFFVGLILTIVFGICCLAWNTELIYVATAPLRPDYREMIKRIDASDERDVLLSDEIYEWNTLCDIFGYEQYMFEYTKGEKK